MRIPTLASLALCALSAWSKPSQSKPFELQLLSTNSSLDGVKLTSCHVGAAIQALCLSDDPNENAVSQTFYLNHSQTAHPNTGRLVWNLETPGTNTLTPMSLTFQYSPGSDIAGMLFFPSIATPAPVVPFSFNKNGTAYIAAADSHPRSNASVYNAARVYRWNICPYTYAGYTFPELVWQLGEAPLKYRDCQKVGVQRIFLS